MQNNNATQIIGNWSLVECVGRSKSGSVFYPYGEKPIGHLSYSSSAHVIVMLANSRRLNFASNDLSKVSDEEKARNFSEFDSYFGTYIVEQEYVIHKILSAKVPNWCSQDHKRYYSISNNQLKLITEPFQMNNEEWEVSVTWRRL